MFVLFACALLPVENPNLMHTQSTHTSLSVFIFAFRLSEKNRGLQFHIRGHLEIKNQESLQMFRFSKTAVSLGLNEKLGLLCSQFPTLYTFCIKSGKVVVSHWACTNALCAFKSLSLCKPRFREILGLITTHIYFVINKLPYMCRYVINQSYTVVIYNFGPEWSSPSLECVLSAFFSFCFFCTLLTELLCFILCAFYVTLLITRSISEKHNFYYDLGFIFFVLLDYTIINLMTIVSEIMTTVCVFLCNHVHTHT